MGIRGEGVCEGAERVAYMGAGAVGVCTVTSGWGKKTEVATDEVELIYGLVATGRVGNCVRRGERRDTDMGGHRGLSHWEGM